MGIYQIVHLDGNYRLFFFCTGRFLSFSARLIDKVYSDDGCLSLYTDFMEQLDILALHKVY